MPADLRLLLEGMLFMVAAILPIVNPLGSTPVFLAMTADCSPDLRATLAKRISINAALILLVSVFIGTYVLDLFGLSVPVVQLAGGILVCAMGWRLLQQDNPVEYVARATPPSPAEVSSRAFYPLTLPLTVGPGSISVAITIGANHPADVRSALAYAVGHILASMAIALTIFLCFRYAERMLNVIGKTGTSVVLRLSAFILLCIGVQIAWNGASALFANLPAHGVR
ncbi:MAG: MarC family protein [Casimicrobiaceae bacterium]